MDGTWARRRLVAGLAVLVVVLGACTSKSEDSNGGSSRGSTLVIAEAATPTSLDSEFVGNQPQNLEAGLNYADPLVQLPTKTNEDGTVDVDVSKAPEPFLAESYERADDGLSFRFTLRKGVKSYFGNELTSADVKYLFERSLGLDGLCGFVMGVSSVDKEDPVSVVDTYTFDINLTKPNPILPLAMATIPICTIYDSTEVKKHATDSDKWAKDWMATHTASFGAYHVETFTPGQETVWVANPNYFKGPLTIQKIIVKAIPEASSRASLLGRGEVDAAVDLTPRQLEELRGNKAVVVESRKGSAGLILGLNNGMPPLDNPKVRQAVAYALPVDEIVSTVFLKAQGVGPAPGYIPGGYPGALDDWPYGNNPDRARQLLQEAGVQNPKVQLSFNTAQAVDEEVAILIQTALRDVGIDVQLQKLSPAKYFEQYFKREAQMVLVNDTPFTPDGPYVLGLYFHPDAGIGPANWVKYNDATVTDLIDRGLASPDPAERTKLAREANQRLVGDAPWGFYLHVGNNFPHLSSMGGYVWQTNNFLRFASFSRKT